MVTKKIRVLHYYSAILRSRRGDSVAAAAASTAASAEAAQHLQLLHLLQGGEGGEVVPARHGGQR